MAIPCYRQLLFGMTPCLTHLRILFVYLNLVSVRYGVAMILQLLSVMKTW
jgi:hypothetical protein